MKILKTLFSCRRWMLWAPVPLAALASASVAEFGTLLVGGLVFWIPYWLAWWLSDGFKGMSDWPFEAPTVTGGGIHPLTGKYCMIHHLPWGDVYV